MIETKKKMDQGFTLLELLISFAIVSILLLGAAQLTLHSVHVKMTSDCSLESAELASDKLEYLKSLFFESQELKESSHVERIRSQKREDVYVREWTVLDVAPDMKKIEVVCYSESCAQRRARIVLFYSRELGF
jgi:prepilin-type N-terminal cleavage/methylation domain-containing protein